MNRFPLALALMLAALPASAEEKPGTAFGTSSSSSSSSYTDGSGNTVTTTTTERDGKRETRRTVIGPGGKVISETNEDGDAAAKPAAQKGKPGGPWLGVRTAELPAAMREQLDLREGEGLLVEQLSPDSPAGTAGIAQHDIILSFNLTPVSTPEQLREELANRRPGEKVLIEYLHKSRRQKAAVTLGKRAATEQHADKEKAPDAPANAAFPAVPPFPAIPALPAPAGANGKAVTNTTTTTFSRTVIVGPDGKTQVIENRQGGDPFDHMLKDPNVPAAMKESIRKMQEQMRDFNKRPEDGIPGKKNEPEDVL